MSRKYAMDEKVSPKWSPHNAETINKLFERIFKATQLAGAGTNGLTALAPAVGDLIVCLAAGIFTTTPIVATVQRVLTNNGGIPTWAVLDLSTGVTGALAIGHGGTGLTAIAQGDLLYGSAVSVLSALAKDANSTRYLSNTGASNNPAWAQVDLSNGVTGRLPLANIVNVSATQRVLGRNTAGAGVQEEVTFTQFLDWVGSAARGDILYRGAASWARLAAGTAGQFLETNGASGDPVWATPSGTGSINDLITQSFYEVHGRPTTPVVMGLPSLTTAGTVGSSQLLYSQGSTVQFIQSGTSVDLRCGFDSGRFDMHEADSDPTWEIVLRTGATITTIRMWLALSDSSMSVSADDEGGTKKYMAFRYSTVAGDGGWVGVTRDGSAQSVTGTVAAIAASTFYKLKIRKSGSTVFFSVNGGTEVSTSSNLPAAATALGFSCQVFNAVAGSTHPWELSRIRCYYGS
jgi:hypothetical protein